MKNCLAVTNISKRYAKGKQFANKELNCEFNEGEITALIGHNGAGKTTLLNQIIGITDSDKGDISYLQESFTKSPKLARSYTSIMPQMHAPLKGVSVRQAISSIGAIRGIDPAALKDEVDDILEALDITKWENQKGEKLSGGLKRLTSFAMAIVGAPKIILLDEPTNDVDPMRRTRLWLYLRKLASRGHILIIVTHNILEVEKYADKYYMLEQGEVKASGNVKSLESMAGHLVRFTVYSQKTMESFPLDCTISDSLEVSARIETPDLPVLLTWLQDALIAKTISNYHLSTLGLNDYYEVLSNEK